MEQFVILYFKKEGCHLCKDLDRLLPLYHHRLLMNYPRAIFHLLKVDVHNRLLPPHPFPTPDGIAPLLGLWYPLFVFIPLPQWESLLEGGTGSWSDFRIIDTVYDGTTWTRRNQLNMFKSEDFLRWVADCLTPGEMTDRVPPPSRELPVITLPPIETMVCKATNRYHHRLRFGARIAKTRCYSITRQTDEGPGKGISK